MLLTFHVPMFMFVFHIHVLSSSVSQFVHVTPLLLSGDTVVDCGRTLKCLVEIGHLSESDRLAANPLALRAYFLLASLRIIIIIIVTGQEPSVSCVERVCFLCACRPENAILRHRHSG